MLRDAKDDTASVQSDAKPTLMVEGPELRRIFTFAERKAALERRIIDSTLAMDCAKRELARATPELAEVNKEFAELQTRIGQRLGIDGVFTITPDGVVIPQG